MSYEAPIKDIMFNLENLSFWDEVTALKAYQDIDISDAHAALEAFGRFCTDTVLPISAMGDHKGSSVQNGTVLTPEPFKNAYGDYVEMGWQSISHPPAFGGMGLPRSVGAATTEILNAADMSFGLCPLLTDGAIHALLLSGSDDQKNIYLEKLIQGQWSGTMNLTEPQAGSDLGRVRCKAEPQKDGSFSITGTKIYITYGDHDLAENIIHLVLARTPNAPAGPKGLSLFIVPKFMVEDDGSIGTKNAVECVSIEHKLGVRASPTAMLSYNGAKGFLVGQENRGLEYMFVMMTSARFSVGIQGVAVSERALQAAEYFAQDRIQGRPIDGSSPDAIAIIGHPDIRRTLMRMRALTEGERALTMFVAGLLDIAHYAEGKTRQEADLMAEFLVPIVKGYCTERSIEITSSCIQVFGGMGFVEETGVAQLYRDARILPIYEGTTAIQANDLLGRKILRDGGKTAKRFSTMIEQTEAELLKGDAEAQAIGTQLGQARHAFDESLAWLLHTAPQDPNHAFAGSVPFLMLTGHLATGWQLARAYLIAGQNIDKGDNIKFMVQKRATARFHAHHILVECTLERIRIIDGATSIYDAA